MPNYVGCNAKNDFILRGNNPDNSEYFQNKNRPQTAKEKHSIYQRPACAGSLKRSHLHFQNLANGKPAAWNLF